MQYTNCHYPFTVENNNTVESGKEHFVGKWRTPGNEVRLDSTTQKCVHRLTVGVGSRFTIKTVHFFAVRGQGKSQCHRDRYVTLMCQYVTLENDVSRSLCNTPTVHNTDPSAASVLYCYGFRGTKTSRTWWLMGFKEGVISRPEPWSCWPQTHPIPNRPTDRQACQ